MGFLSNFKNQVEQAMAAPSQAGGSTELAVIETPNPRGGRIFGQLGEYDLRDMTPLDGVSLDNGYKFRMFRNDVHVFSTIVDGSGTDSDWDGEDEEIEAFFQFCERIHPSAGEYAIDRVIRVLSLLKDLEQVVEEQDANYELSAENTFSYWEPRGLVFTPEEKEFFYHPELIH